jgi:hypothetical protein
MMELYFERPIDHDLRRRMAAMTAASLLRETLWSMVSEETSAIGFDYRSYTNGNVVLSCGVGNHVDLRGLPGGVRSPAKPVSTEATSLPAGKRARNPRFSAPML